MNSKGKEQLSVSHGKNNDWAGPQTQVDLTLKVMSIFSVCIYVYTCVYVYHYTTYFILIIYPEEFHHT